MNDAAVAFLEASWFPVDLDVAGAHFGFLRLDPSVLEGSVFLDTRILAPLDRAQQIPAAEVARDAPAIDAAAPPAFLFHTSFCCSTLLARALHVRDHSVALKEPLVLRRLADAQHARASIAALLPPSLRLLARPWTRGGRVVIKPTHAALNIGTDLLLGAPGANALLLYGSMEDFLISNLKKPTETQRKVPELIERALRASALHERLPAEALAPPDFLSAVALQWCAQMDLAAQILDGPAGARVRALRETDLLADVPGVVRRAARWLQLGLPESALQARLDEVSQRHAKVPDAAYDAQRRAADAAKVRLMFGADINAALRWAERVVLPALRAAELSPLL